jgi:hypothetical protein
MTGGRYKDVKGCGKYKWVKAPPDYPGHVYVWGHRVLEHHLVWWRHTGKAVPPGWIVHHKNGNRGDNAYANLSPPEPTGVHTREHNLLENDRIVECTWCGKQLSRTARDVRSKNSQGQMRFFCNGRHAALQLWKEGKGRGGGGGRLKYTHGNYNCYRAGCRCTKCRNANAARTASYLRKQRNLGA